jgi:glycosyltransferase involved in cell wall biosynthesis
VPLHDTRALADALVRPLEHEAFSRALAVGARRFIEEKFGGDSQIEATLRVYENGSTAAGAAGGRR